MFGWHLLALKSASLAYDYQSMAMRNVGKVLIHLQSPRIAIIAGLNPKRTPFRGIRNYLSTLQTLASQRYTGEEWRVRCFAALNGEASSELRRAASIKVRRKFGAFFTGTDLSKRLMAHRKKVDKKSIFYDPSCGMGDLLLAVAKLLPLGKTLKQTLRNWGRRIAGTDLHEEFVRAAKTRLMILARQRHGANNTLNTSTVDYFPNICVANGLLERRLFRRSTHLLMNPPFGVVVAPLGCDWAGGRITEAATFIITALERARPGTEVLAILPEVLRSGSFSLHWRNKVSELAEVHLVRPYGIFDESADVDVFLLRLVRRSPKSKKTILRWPQTRQRALTTVASSFTVHVGRVVPHRDKKAGPRYAYIHPRCIPTWKVIKRLTESRKHKGRVYTPPFVVVRRTSRPGHPYRATATIISGKRSVAVENHLIVCEPKDKKLATCKKLMRQLKTEAVNEHLNARIRCRHLTVGAVADIPFYPSAR